MNYHHYPGVGNRGGAGHNQGADFRQGQNPLSRPYTGPHGTYGLGNPASPPQAPHAQISQTAAAPSLLPAIVPNHLPEANITPAPPKKGFSLANLASMANLTEIKGFVDRMGGLDGILSTVTKVQKVVGSISQMAPLVKVLFGSFGKKSISQSDELNSERKPTRRKRPRSGSGSGSGKARSGASGKRRSSKRRR
ncbi:hypothetical protein D3P08_02935 [Paenibacillus nanensis]|uniref:Tyrosine protein kinase n=1 Tax=Paenibacillus nanensis TaxID=393251 RepID=A0A3A1VHX2_9BACL|nr:hypothetical protein [Paenibacillus nanensis]RIX60529.1 hypothetical protein D3P08_02935 [Paenibacillus nanensis]